MYAVDIQFSGLYFYTNSQNLTCLDFVENSCQDILVKDMCSLLQSCKWCTHNTQCTPHNTACDAVENQVSWVKPEGGDWSDETGWSSGVVPSATDHVNINLYGNYIVTLSTSGTDVIEVASITVGRDCQRSPCHHRPTLRLSGSVTVSGSITIEALGIVELHEVAGTLTVDGITNNGIFNILGPWTITGANAVTNYNLMQFTGGRTVNPVLITFALPLIDEAGGHLIWASGRNDIAILQNFTIQEGARFYISSAERLTGSNIINHGTTIFRARGDYHLFVYSDFINTGSIISDNQFKIFGKFNLEGGQVSMHPGRKFEVEEMDTTDASDGFTIAVTEITFNEGTHSTKTSHVADCEKLVLQRGASLSLDNDQAEINSLYVYGGTLVLQNDAMIRNLHFQYGIIDCQGHTIVIKHLNLLQIAYWINPQKEFKNCNVDIEYNVYSTDASSVNFQLKEACNFTVKQEAIFALRGGQQLTIVDSGDSSFTVHGDLVLNYAIDVQPTFTSTGRILVSGTGVLRLRKSVNVESGSLIASDGTEVALETGGPHVIQSDVLELAGLINVKSNVRMKVKDTYKLQGHINVQANGELYLEGQTGHTVTLKKLTLDGSFVRADNMDIAVFTETTLTNGKLYVNDKATFNTLNFYGNSYNHYPEIVITGEDAAPTDGEINVLNIVVQSSYRWAKIVGDFSDITPTVNVVKNFLFHEQAIRNEHLELENINLKSQGFSYMNKFSHLRLTGENSSVTFTENSETLCRGGSIQMSTASAENRVVTLNGSLTIEDEATTIAVPVISSFTSKIQIFSGTLSFSKSSHVQGTIHASGNLLFTGDQRETLSHVISVSSLTTDLGKIRKLSCIDSLRFIFLKVYPHDATVTVTKLIISITR